MRNAFAAEITELAAKDERIVLLSGDIGNRLFDKFRERFPDRFYNCGVAEAQEFPGCAVRFGVLVALRIPAQGECGRDAEDGVFGHLQGRGEFGHGEGAGLGGEQFQKIQGAV